MASIKKLPSGKFQATIYLGRDENGKQLKKKITRDSERECKKVARDIEQEIEDRMYVSPTNTHFIKYAEAWLSINKNRLSPTTYETYKIYVDVHFDPFFKGLRINKITDVHIRRYLNEKLEKYSSTYVRKHYMLLRSILYDALKYKSPCRDIKAPEKSDFVPHVLSDADFSRLHDIVRGTRDEPIILLAAWCGLRRGEIFALKWNDIDWNEGTLRVDENRALSADGYIDKKPKSKKGLRTIVLPEYLLKLLECLRLSQTEIKERIFCLRPDHYSNYFKKLSDKHDFRIRFHDLRHYHASWLYSQKIPDQYAAQRMGHDISILKGIYQHLGLEDKKEIDNVIRTNFSQEKGGT